VPWRSGNVHGITGQRSFTKEQPREYLPNEPAVTTLSPCRDGAKAIYMTISENDNNPSAPLTLVIHYPVPSLNHLFALGHWQRRKEKQATQAAVLSALRRAVLERSIQTTAAPSILSTACAMLESYMTTDQRTLSCKSSRRKSRTRKTRKRLSK
jgi:hypothetical protein